MTSLLADSELFTKKDMVPTQVPMINVALSGTINGGITPGLTMLAGPSKHFKTGFALLLVSAFLKKYKDGIVLFYDSEFGSPQGYFESFNIDTSSIVHTPIINIEELKHDISVQLSKIERNDKVMVIIDSIGNLASKKEVDDAIEGKTVADMSRAKALKSLFRIVTPQLTLKNIPMVVINHTYKEIGLYPRDIVGGGTGSYYGSDNIWILGRQQEKEGTEIAGYHFVINVEKSRYVKEKSKIPITVTYEGGINKWSGLFDLALEAGFIAKTKTGWYAVVNKETGEVGDNKRAGDMVDDDNLWQSILNNTNFAEWISSKYQLTNGNVMQDEEVSE
jgi:RecA/RadA recombinase